ncbi:MAG TPA: sulfatase-like hydrolase/transferase [Lacipirellula sp.]
MMKLKLISLFAAAVAVAFVANCYAASDAQRPNVVLILADNQGPWTLGCYGNPEIRTPNIDRLAREGVLFEHCYSSNAVCSPTRATLLTGLIPSQHGVHSYLPAGAAQVGPRAYSTIREFRSLPEILADAGYVCGLSGKWHLGANLRPQEGFTYWVTMPTGHTTAFYGAEVIESGEVRKEAGYLTDFWADRGVEFIEQNKDRPFFLYLAFNGPYGLGESLTHAARNRHGEYYADKPMESFPREEMHPWLHGNKRFLNNVEAMRRYAAEVSGVDDGVGEVLKTLEKHGLDENTLVIYTADQGLAGGHSGFWGMGDHTRPRTGYDWTMHTPLVFRHPTRVEKGQRSPLLVSNYDFLPTVLEYLGLDDKTPESPRLPGHSYAAALEGKPLVRDDYIFFEYDDVRAVRTPRWKYITRHPAGPNELYDLQADPDECENLIDSPAHRETQSDLERRLREFFDEYAELKYDRTRGGASKADRGYFPQD